MTYLKGAKTDIKGASFNGSEIRLFKDKRPLQIGDILKITVNPRIKEDGIIYNGDYDENLNIDDVHSIAQYRLKIVRQVRLLFNNTSDFFNLILYPDFSKTLRLHFHGFITIDEQFDFDDFTMFFHEKFFKQGAQSDYNIIVEKLGDKEDDRYSWLNYCMYTYNELKKSNSERLIKKYGPKGVDELIIINNVNYVPENITILNNRCVTTSYKPEPVPDKPKRQSQTSDQTSEISISTFHHGQPAALCKFNLQNKSTQPLIKKKGRPLKDKINN